MTTTSAAVPATAGPIFCVTLRMVDRPRPIDRVIDYFGDPPRDREASQPRVIAERWPDLA
jgi:hypothetical protein